MMARTTRRGEKSIRQVREEERLRAELLANRGTSYSTKPGTTGYGRDGLIRMHESRSTDEGGAPAMKEGFVAHLSAEANSVRPRRVISVREAADATGLSYDVVLKLVQERRIPSRRPGGLYGVYVDGLIAYMEETGTVGEDLAILRADLTAITAPPVKPVR